MSTDLKPTTPVEQGPPPPARPLGRGTVRAPLWATVTKWVLIALAVLLGAYLVQRVISAGYGIGVVVVAVVVMAVVAVYSTRRAVPMKYLLPGLVLLLALQVWPIVYTVATAFTNYGDGHAVSKEEATRSIIANSVQEVPGTPRYRMSVAVPAGSSPDTGDLALLLTDPQGKSYVGTSKGLKDLPSDGVSKTVTGKITAAKGWTILTARQVNARKDLANLAVPTSDGGGIKPVGLSEAFVGKTTIVYDAAKDTLTNTTTGKVYVPRNAFWVPQDGQGDAFPTGWKENVGLKNFSTLLTNETIRAGFLSIFVWNVVFAVVSVGSTFLLGMLLALLFDDNRIKGRKVYRSILILPYAIPGFVTALLWRSMFNQDFGLINNLTGLDVDWLGNPWAAKAAILLTNLWLGFPYMFLVCTGALQSIPGDVREAAKIDGASPFRTLRSIIMPLLLVAVGPLLIASFAFNFNNFGLIYLLTKGGPYESADTSIGSSDLLITYAFRLAFSGVTPNYGLASTVSIFIFVIVALMSYAGFRRTKNLEEVN
ncbi:ABC transporter permease subunit [Lapillicoccus jejuensis]|uniref:Maltose/maltodextrin transport system permease protein n=1 Tax=Lapillicoccus jejuensis TaxID=402171 RepID=A0A542E0T8_9MICO|nr:ABC transporter permease subunit [Lapillicoccus jejuensis]TQJ08889.1 carbohydrate ABC transporter membrane protein 1 (CUT1 family) [Lapillicoccus jejuensis]